MPKPLKLDIPLFVSDMSFGALSQEAKVALSRGAELAGTGICSGEGGMLDDEQASNSNTFMNWLQVVSAMTLKKLKSVRLSILKAGKQRKQVQVVTYLVIKSLQIAEVRGLPEGQVAISPATFPDWTDLFNIKLL